jgi:plastocyanin domain-containing protein
MTNDLKPNEKYAITDLDEIEAEMREDRNSEDFDTGAEADRIWEIVRDNNSVDLMENVDKLIENANGLVYYKNNSERIAKDIIQAVLSKLKVKIEVTNVSSKYQSIQVKLRGKRKTFLGRKK